MNAKGWIGSEIVFDFDADHMKELRGKPNVKGGLLAEADWKVVKAKVEQLVDDFLLQDFGIDENDITINFSGNRGFHVRVRSSDYMDLGQEGRRRLVSYINGADLDVDAVAARLRSRKRVRDVAFSQPGWMERIRRKIEDEKLSLEDAVAQASLDVDENVVLDLHRLIRHTNTLHAGTGLVVMPVPRDSLDEFVPYEDAMIKTEEEVRIRLKDLRAFEGVDVAGIVLSPSMSSEVVRLPISLAIFLTLKGLAELVEG